MKLSTKGRYSVTALYELAQHYGKGIVPLKSIALSQGLSENYLEQLMGTLRKAGLVTSTRGAQGGYELARSPEKITICDIIVTNGSRPSSIYDIITAAEGPIALVDCLLADEKSSHPCARAGECVTRGIWEKVCDSINEVLGSITLADLCRDSRHGNVGCGR